jgi:hypothetical protein
MHAQRVNDDYRAIVDRRRLRNSRKTGMCWERIPASWGALPGFLNMWYPTILSVEEPERLFG